MEFPDGSREAVMAVHMLKDGKIIRTTPIDFDDDDPQPWTIRAQGMDFTPPRKTTLAPHGMNSKSMIYSPDRLLYPMKRVDFDPKGQRNPQNRGKSGYVRISWEEALDIVAGEIKRVKQEHGPGAMGVSPPSASSARPCPDRTYCSSMTEW